MKVAIVKESAPNERRVALVPEAIGKLTGAGHEVLLQSGADPDAKYLAITSSPSLSRLVDMVRAANDFDGDGFGSLLGEKDCAPFNARLASAPGPAREERKYSRCPSALKAMSTALYGPVKETASGLVHTPFRW